MMEYQPMAELPKGLDSFTRAYLECAEWCGVVDDQEREALELSVRPRWAQSSVAEAVTDCGCFQKDNAADLEGMDPAQAGHDFWLTRNRHGTGFWDRGLGALGDKLTAAAHVWGEVNASFDEDTATLSLG